MWGNSVHVSSLGASPYILFAHGEASERQSEFRRLIVNVNAWCSANQIMQVSI